VEIIEPSRLKLGSLQPLVEHLLELATDIDCDRRLSWDEDERACELLLNLPEARKGSFLHTKILCYVDPDCRPFRTLGTWFCITRTIALVMHRG